MAKNTSLFGKVSGKLGAVVFSTSGGQTISREYNPHVSNPNTQAQVDQRARMKLMSQLSAVLSPVIAMTKDGLVSKRNKFVKRNFANSIAQNGNAQITYENVQLTEGNAPLTGLIGSVDSDANALVIGLGDIPAPNISRVVYCVFTKDATGTLQLLWSTISSDKEQGLKKFYWFEVTIPDSVLTAIDRETRGWDLVVYAYGMADNSERATAQFGNMRVRNASDLATLVATRAVDFTDYTFTQTRGATWLASADTMETAEAGKVRLFLTALSTNGSVSGSGSFDIGASVTATATPNQGYEFVEWRLNGTSQVVSTANPYTFNIQEDTDLIAIFGERGGL